MSERPIPDPLRPVASSARTPLPPHRLVDRFQTGIVPCAIPHAFRMGATNCWLVIGVDDVLCVDPGADAEGAVREIGAALKPHGRRVEDVETIVVTHTHADHCGAAAGLAEVADAAVAVGAPEVDRLAGRPASPSTQAAAWRGLGAPPDELRRAAHRPTIHAPVDPARIRSLHDGTKLEAGGRTWDVHVVGGHSPGHVLLGGDGMILAGDQLLADVFPAVHFGPAVSDPDRSRSAHDPPLPWASSVAELLASMDRFDGEAFESITVLPGHGSAFRGTQRVIERVRRYHRVRCELVAQRLAQRGPTSVWDLATAMYPGLVTSEGFDRRFASAAAEIAGRLEALQRAGRATHTVEDGTVLFAPGGSLRSPE